MAITGLGQGTSNYNTYYDPRNASYDEIKSLNSYLIQEGWLREEDIDAFEYPTEDKTQKADYYNALRAWRDVQFRVGNMVGYKNAAKVCDAWSNAIKDQEGTTEYLETSQGKVKVYAKEGRLESGILDLSVFGDGNQAYSLTASYAEDSTTENPMIEVRLSSLEGQASIQEMTVKIAVNEVDVTSATQLEMFALCSHGDKQGLAGFSKTGESYLKLISEAAEGSSCTQASNLTEFLGTKQDWSALEKTTEAQIQSLLEERIAADNGVPYNHLAKDGIIEYNGVTFVCDEKHKAICLGDVSNLDDCLRIPLSEGGCLIVNRDNLGELANAISMFSPEDVNLIMRAIAQDAKVQQMKNEIEDESEVMNLVSE
ncbi:MAG: hypothetical protein J6B68_10165 [Lachnospiraceae bacterium]|nr:hypothetical protein [Lachnospiraceae bacterium]